MQTHDKSKTAAAATREKILDAAEQLLINKGFAGTSLRAIASHAEVNLAASNYHFGCKEGLFAAVVHRRFRPINEQRLASLDALEERAIPTTSEIVEAFLAPLTSPDFPEYLPAVIGRISSEPEEGLKEIIRSEFGEISARYTAALATAIPQVDEEEIAWRFHFFVGGMLHLVSHFNPLALGETEVSKKERFNKLLTFAVAGLEAAQPHETKNKGTLK